MSKPRTPKNLGEYSTAEGAARGLEALAADIRRNATAYPLVRWTCNIRHWNPAWAEGLSPQPYHAPNANVPHSETRPASPVVPQADHE